MRTDDVSNLGDSLRRVKHSHVRTPLSPLRSGSKLEPEPPDLDDGRALLERVEDFCREGRLSPNPFVTIAAIELLGQQGVLVDEVLGRRPRDQRRATS
jgi:hypothetical protein